MVDILHGTGKHPTRCPVGYEMVISVPKAFLSMPCRCKTAIFDYTPSSKAFKKTLLSILPWLIYSVRSLHLLLRCFSSAFSPTHRSATKASATNISSSPAIPHNARSTTLGVTRRYTVAGAIVSNARVIANAAESIIHRLGGVAVWAISAIRPFQSPSLAQQRCRY